MTSAFHKLSVKDDKPSVPRFLAVSSTSFSYYLSEDHFNYSDQLFILRIYHQDISEIGFSIDYSPGGNASHKEDTRYQVSIFAIKCIKSKQNIAHQVVKLGFKSYSNHGSIRKS
jgi:hypothetical protein